MKKGRTRAPLLHAELLEDLPPVCRYLGVLLETPPTCDTRPAPDDRYAILSFLDRAHRADKRVEALGTPGEPKDRWSTKYTADRGPLPEPAGHSCPQFIQRDIGGNIRRPATTSPADAGRR